MDDSARWGGDGGSIKAAQQLNAIELRSAQFSYEREREEPKDMCAYDIATTAPPRRTAPSTKQAGAVTLLYEIRESETQTRPLPRVSCVSQFRGTSAYSEEGFVAKANVANWTAINTNTLQSHHDNNKQQ